MSYDDSQYAVGTIVSWGKGGELFLQMDMQGVSMAKLSLDSNGKMKFAQGGLNFPKCNVERYVMPVLRALMLFDGAYEVLKYDSNANLSEISADGFVIYLSEFNADGIPAKMEVKAEYFNLVLNLLSWKNRVKKQL